MAAVVSNYGDGFVVITAPSATYGPYSLLGGQYFFTTTAAGTSVALNYLQPDGSTYTAVGTSTTFTTSAGNASVYLPPGVYQVVVVTSSAIAFSLTRIPTRGP